MVVQRLPTDSITSSIIGGAIEVHRFLGPGMDERTYEMCMGAELKARGHHVERQVRVPVRYRGIYLERAFRMDLLVEGCVVVEVKAVSALAPVHVSQVLAYLRFANLDVGLLFNFNVDVLAVGGWKRILRMT